MKVLIKDINSYLKLQSKEDRDALERIRKIVHELVPNAEEVISYGMPGFKYHGMLIGFAAFKKHCSLFPWNASTVVHFEEDLKKYTTSKGTIQFTLDKQLSVTLIKKIVKFRMKQNIEKHKAKIKK